MLLTKMSFTERESTSTELEKRFNFPPVQNLIKLPWAGKKVAQDMLSGVWCILLNSKQVFAAGYTYQGFEPVWVIY